MLWLQHVSTLLLILAGVVVFAGDVIKQQLNDIPVVRDSVDPTVLGISMFVTGLVAWVVSGVASRVRHLDPDHLEDGFDPRSIDQRDSQQAGGCAGDVDASNEPVASDNPISGDKQRPSG